MELEPTIVFMDVEMPEVNGLEAARVIGEEGLAPVVMVTAFSQAAYVKEAAEAGAMAYLTKPFTKQDILPAMEVAVARFAEAQALAEQVSDLDERLETRKLVDRAKAAAHGQGHVGGRRVRPAAEDSRWTSACRSNRWPRRSSSLRRPTRRCATSGSRSHGGDPDPGTDGA